MSVTTLVAIIIEIAGLITAVGVIVNKFNKIFDKKLEPINQSIHDLDEATCKNYLVTFLKGIEKGEEMDEVEIERAYEVYDHYSNVLYKNGYIHSKWKKLMERK